MVVLGAQNYYQVSNYSYIKHSIKFPGIFLLQLFQAISSKHTNFYSGGCHSRKKCKTLFWPAVRGNDILAGNIFAANLQVELP